MARRITTYLFTRSHPDKTEDTELEVVETDEITDEDVLLFVEEWALDL